MCSNSDPLPFVRFVKPPPSVFVLFAIYRNNQQVSVLPNKLHDNQHHAPEVTIVLQSEVTSHTFASKLDIAIHVQNVIL